MIKNEKLEYSFLKGGTFKFIDNNSEIILQCAPFSGKEEVLFNNDLVSQSRNQKFTSEHNFTANGHEYSILLKLKGFCYRKIECSLSKDKFHLSTYKLEYSKPQAGFIKRNIPSVLLGSAIGIIYSLKLAPTWTLAVAFIAGIAAMTINQLKNGCWSFQEINVRSRK